ncbi:MAG: hypothetical protein IRZ33_07520 [Alicyclobacillaceae bacterium]|nr:hypothetical protein [Alicyclobacillaceae bacterium]
MTPQSRAVLVVVPEYTMAWIAGWFPLLSFAAGVALYAWLGRVWLVTVVVLAGTVVPMALWFTMHFWSWILMYLFIAWLGCWAGSYLRKRRLGSRRASAG